MVLLTESTHNHSTKLNGRRFDVLDSWRGILALLVAFGHLAYWNGHADVLPISFVLAVDFFFLLSGFVIANSMFRSASLEEWLRDFAVRRFFRIYPLYITAALLAALITQPLRGVNVFADRPPNILSWLTLLQMSGISNVDANVIGSTPMGIGWALSIETWLCVFFFGVVAAFKSKLRLVLTLVAVCIASLQVLTTYSPNFMDIHYWKFGPIHFGVFRGLAGFSAGVLVYLLFQRVKLLKLHSVFEIGAVGLVLLLYWQLSYARGTEYLAPIVASLVIFIFAHEGGALSRFLLLPPFRAFGRWSFGIYIAHPLFIDLLVVSRIHLTVIRALVYLAVVVCFAWMLHRLIELPGMKLGNRLVNRIR